MRQVKKLDRRFKGSENFSHRIEFTSRSIWDSNLRNQPLKEFLELRNSLWANFGPSAEIQFIGLLDQKPNWAWCNDPMSVYITEEAYTFVILMHRWGD